jgi:hypothetical protein
MPFVDVNGNPAGDSTTLAINGFLFPAPLFTTCDVFLVVPPNAPAGPYRVKVRSAENLVDVAPDREYTISYDITGQVITPPIGVGVGPGGAGNSIAVGEFDTAGIGTAYPCAVKVFLDQGNGSGGYSLYQFGLVAIGDNTGSDVCGVVFDDLNGDGVRDGGEAGIAGVTVMLNGAIIVVTQEHGEYCFEDQPGGTYTVSVQFGASWIATTPTSDVVTAGGCCPVDGPIFGARGLVSTNCDARTPGYWSGPHGRRYIGETAGALADLIALPLVDDACNPFDPANATEFSRWLKRRNAANMAYQLSGHLAAMWLNIASGNVSPGCLVNDPVVGVVSAQDLVAMAIAALAADGCTPAGDPNRASHEILKNALDRANNNQTWN